MKLLYLLVFVAVTGCVHSREQLMKPNKPGTIIILNGASGSGKSSIQREIQKQMAEPYLGLGIDNLFIGVMPPHYFEAKMTDISKALQGLPKNSTALNIDIGPDIMTGIATHDEKGQLYKLKVGKEGEKIIRGMHQAIRGYAVEGNNVVVDYILYDASWLPHLVNTLQNFDVYFIGVNLPLDILEKREAQRRTSPKGHARSHYYSVHQHVKYDFIVDTSKCTAKECAKQIVEFMNNHSAPSAFKQLMH